MSNDILGAPVPGQALVSDQAATRLDPSGFDPSRSFRLLGFATGMYMGDCPTCGVQYMGDKRSRTCLACAAVEADHLILLRLRRIAKLEKALDRIAGYEIVAKGRYWRNVATLMQECARSALTSGIDAGTGETADAGSIAQRQEPGPEGETPKDLHLKEASDNG